MKSKSLKLQETLANLKALLAINDARIRTDPIPYLEQAYNSLKLANNCIKQIEEALNPVPIISMGGGFPAGPVDVQSEALLRCEQVNKILAEYLELQQHLRVESWQQRKLD